MHEAASMNRDRRLGRYATMGTLLALSIFFGAAHAAPRHRNAAAKAGKSFSYTVSDCQAQGTLPSIRLEVSESSVAFNQILTMNCIAATRPSTVKLAYVKKGSDLEVSVVLRSEVYSDCTCPIAVEGTIANLAKGDYRIAFVYDHQPGDSPKSAPTRQTLATKGISIP
jgi:hypothetical protein